MRANVIHLLSLCALTVVARSPLAAQDARITFLDKVTLRVTSTDSSRVARFALIGAGLSVTGSRTDIVLGDTIYMYTPAKFTIRAYTDSAVVVSLPDQPSLDLGVVAPGGQKPPFTFTGRRFDVLRATGRP